MSKEKNYQEAYNELIAIVHELESNSVTIDEMSKKVKRAAELARFCKEKLQMTEKEIAEILEEIQNKEE